jgi:sugar phosphate isomerase/epimerase
MFSTLAPRALPIRVSFERALDLAAKYGFDALDLPIERLLARPPDPELIKHEFAVRGVRAGGWQLPFDYQALGAAEFRTELPRLARAARLAQAIDGPWCYYWIEPFSDHLSYAANEAMQIERVRAMSDVLGEHGCLLALEYIGPRTLLEGQRHPFVHTMPQALALLEAIDRPNVGLLLDCYHWYTSRGTLEEIEALTAAQVVYVHINDAPPGVEIDMQLDQVRCLPGATGVIDLVAFLRALDRIGYEGPVAVEPFDAALAALPVDQRVARAAESLDAAFAGANITP